MICICRNCETPEKLPPGFCEGCEKNNPQAYHECIRQRGGTPFTFADGTRIILKRGEG